MAVKFICCDVFKEEILAMNPPPQIEFEFISMGLHLHPAKLHLKVQETLDKSQGYERIILGFGLCGGSLRGIRSPGCPMVMPRVHDCIPVLLGCTDRHDKLQQEDRGTFYFSGGWVEGDRMMISEFQRSCVQFGHKRALKIFHMMFKHYNRLVYIHTGHPRDAEALDKTREFAGILDLPCCVTPGDMSYLERLLKGPWDEADFVLISPGGVVKEEEFIRAGEEIRIQGA